MKPRVFNWGLLLLAAGLFHVIFRYWAGDFQGYLTFGIDGTEYGFAHIKAATEWVSGRKLTPLPGGLIFAALLANLAWLAYEVRRVYRSSIR